MLEQCERRRAEASGGGIVTVVLRWIFPQLRVTQADSLIGWIRYSSAEVVPMLELLLIIVIVLFLFGGGGFFYRGRRR